MLFWMTSKVFRDVFLNNESDQDILDAQYVLVSTRIVRKDTSLENIINAKTLLYPDAEVCMALDDETLRERYFDQLMGTRAFLATIIKGSIEEKYNIIFLCTKSEQKHMRYLEYLSHFILLEFDYPCYEYKNYANGATKLISYKKDKVLKKCDKILESAKENEHKKKLSTDKGRKEIMKDYKLLKAKDLKAILKDRNLYHKDMDKSDMLDMIETFL